ncbi:MAG: PAS domain-containing protein [Haloferacaceae archaeon]
MDASTHREELYETFAGTEADVDEMVARALDVGTAYLGLPVGFQTRIEDGNQEVVRATGDHDLIQPGETCPLDDAYCRRTIEVDGSLAVRDATTSTAIADAAVRTFGLGTYLGAKVVVNDELHGTVCFADTDTRDAPFSEAEEVFVELFAKLVGQAIERRNHEQELRRRNERLEREKRRFQGIAETSSDVLFRVDRDATFTYVSAAVERILGYASDELVGSPFATHVTGASVADAMAAYDRVLAGETVDGVELTFRDIEDEPVVLEVNGTPIEEGGEVVGVQGVGRDVTARKEREEELRIKTRAMDEARVGISIADNRRPDTPLVYVNDGFERLAGYGADEALGRNCRFLQGEATDPDTVDELRAAIDANEPVATEILNYRADGTPFWNHLRISPVEDADGEVSHHLGFQTDVTGRKRTDHLVRLLNRVLRHNLRNDMNAILGFSRLLQEGSVDDVAAIGARIETAAERLIDLTEQARELERSAGSERDPQRLDPATFLDDVAGTHRERFPDATVDLTVRTERGICAGPELADALSELVENGLCHNPEPDPWVGVEARDDGEWVEVVVADDGPGIDPVEAAVIAEGEETPLRHGRGLGLWRVNWVVTRYGGSFQIRSGDDGDDEAEGTVATVRLPGIDPGTPVAAVARDPTVLFR